MKNSFVWRLVLLLFTSSFLISCIPEQPAAPIEKLTALPLSEKQNEEQGQDGSISDQPSAPVSSPTPLVSSPSPVSSLPLASPPAQEYRPPLYATVLYNQDQLIFEHYWPNTAFLKGDESEILVYNEGTAPVQITASDQIFILGDKTYTQYSGTWEKFPSRQSWNRIDYININPNYYAGQSLILEPGQKGKLHWHYQFEGDISRQQQAAEITISFTGQRKSYLLDKKLVREGSLPYPTPRASSSEEPQDSREHQEEGQNTGQEEGH